MISFAQNFEDVILNRAFRGKKKGFYIDLGAHDPDFESVTKHFYNLGWSGINVEPVERFFSLFIKKRPRDINIHAAVSLSDGYVEFYDWGQTGLSTYKETFDTELFSRLGYKRNVTRVPSITLENICKQAGDNTIDFLKIDIEGAEKDALLSNDWVIYRPKIIVIEAIKAKLPGSDIYSYEPSWFDWEGILIDNGYEFALFDGLNRYYFQREDPSLRNPLSYPANITDGFKLTKGHLLSSN